MRPVDLLKNYLHIFSQTEVLVGMTLSIVTTANTKWTERDKSVLTKQRDGLTEFELLLVVFLLFVLLLLQSLEEGSRVVLFFWGL